MNSNKKQKPPQEQTEKTGMGQNSKISNSELGMDRVSIVVERDRLERVVVRAEHFKIKKSDQADEPQIRSPSKKSDPHQSDSLKKSDAEIPLRPFSDPDHHLCDAGRDPDFRALCGAVSGRLPASAP